MKAAIHLSGGTAHASDGYVIKEILRTGTWPVVPTTNGIVKKPLRIIRDGRSDAASGTIALSEVVANFKAGAIENVQIPLSDDSDDHKNLTRLNTGFVRDIYIVDQGDVSKLVARMHFTDPDVREKVLNGTYADVSCGIPWTLTSRGRTFGATLDHVAITNRPFIDGLSGFALAASITTGTQERAQAVLAAMTGSESAESLRSRARAVRASMEGKVDDDLNQRVASARQALFGVR